MILIFDCKKCDRVWAREFPDERPILSIPGFDPYRSRCPSCKKTRQARRDSETYEPEGGAVG